MTSLRVVCLLAVLTVPFAAGQSNSVAHAGQLSARTYGQKMPDALVNRTSTPKTARIFGKGVAYDTGSSDSGLLTTADLNEDGKPDVVLAGCCGGSTVSVMLGNGDGTLQAPVGYNVGGEQATSIAVGDVNGDGHQDLIVVTYYEAGNANSGGVAVLLGRGDGTFQAPVSYSSGGFYAIAVAIADVNGDGHPDLIVANQCLSSSACSAPFIGDIEVLLGKGDGTFQKPSNLITVETIYSLTAADLNSDGKTDLVFMNGDIGVLLGNGDGTFQPGVYYAARGVESPIAIVDVNGDGKPDLVDTVDCPTGCPSMAVSVLLGNGDGTFQAPILSSLPVEDDFSIVVQDLDGDGKPDVVVGGYLWHDAYALLGNGDGTFQPGERYGLPWRNTSSVGIADLNANGKPDLLVTGNCVKCTDPDLTLQILPNIFNAPTVIAVTSSPNPSVIDESVTFTATISSNPPVPDGAVINFVNGKNILGSGSIKDGVASFTTSLPKAQTYIIKAEYPGDLFHRASLAATMKQVVTH